MRWLLVLTRKRDVSVDLTDAQIGVVALCFDFDAFVGHVDDEALEERGQEIASCSVGSALVERSRVNQGLQEAECAGLRRAPPRTAPARGGAAPARDSANQSPSGVQTRSAKAAERLGWTVTRFNRKLDNVCDKLDRLGVPGMREGQRSVATNRRVRLVEYAIASRLVTRADLELLDLPSDDDGGD